ncbi:glucosamine inositolphosphorylceramide transferase family protein [Devosia ginsengisoli]|uniref:Glucosamine inositolphosphorylceramide transferase 1 N-terminal domain-containing protein n=1 Tax=Devosia ginsengisoli TaxID=400770 RepID=A0A5B8LRF7_9HYPH|nr:hypothetical protein [Devosia ginsengisoli]QDZ09800.1 hypothetical protein FPZ08_02990 [Devosia ginsengisoli]
MLLRNRLRAQGYQADLCEGENGAHRASVFNRILSLEAKRFGPCLASRASVADTTSSADADLVIDLTGRVARQDRRTLSLTIAGQSSVSAGFAEMFASGDLPELVVWRGGAAVASATPMISNMLWLSRAADELLAGAAALLEQATHRYFAGKLSPVAIADTPPPRHGFLRHYLPHAARAAFRQASARLGRRRPFYWQVGYRQAAGFTPEQADLGPAVFTVLPDDGERFYADPFLFAHDGQTFLFVEEFPYALGRGVVSVSMLEPAGHFGRPRIVLEEAYHLSYPQVIAHAGEIFMLPESGGAKRLVLYRAETFPERWVVDTVLLEGVDINDATLIRRDGLFYLFATMRVGPGSASDTMVVYSAADLRGPYTPHRLNPIAIDRSGARPGGTILSQDGRFWLKVQDGTKRYGGGLGLREILQLDADDVRLGPVLPIAAPITSRFAAIHTFNSAAGLEVVDSAG